MLLFYGHSALGAYIYLSALQEHNRPVHLQLIFSVNNVTYIILCILFFVLRVLLFMFMLGPFCRVGAFLQSWGLSAGYQPRPQVVDRGTTARYGGQLRYI